MRISAWAKIKCKINVPGKGQWIDRSIGAAARNLEKFDAELAERLGSAMARNWRLPCVKDFAANHFAVVSPESGTTRRAGD